MVKSEQSLLVRLHCRFKLQSTVSDRGECLQDRVCIYLVLHLRFAWSTGRTAPWFQLRLRRWSRPARGRPAWVPADSRNRTRSGSTAADSCRRSRPFCTDWRTPCPWSRYWCSETDSLSGDFPRGSTDSTGCSSSRAACFRFPRGRTDTFQRSSTPEKCRSAGAKWTAMAGAPATAPAPANTCGTARSWWTAPRTRRDSACCSSGSLSGLQDPPSPVPCSPF